MSAGTDELSADLTPQEKRALLAKLLQRKAGARKTFPLSFAQSRLWILDRFQSGNPTYNLPMALRLPGLVDVEVLERSFNEIARRHDALRTTFEMMDGKPVQVVSPMLALKVPCVDLRSTPEDVRQAEASRVVFEESRHPFDLSKGPLIRATLVRLGDADHLLVVVMHHIVSDGWSLGVLYQELSTLYAAYGGNRPSPLAELPIQYADYARWQTEWLTGQVLREQLDYWRTQLDGVGRVLNLPTDRPRLTMQSNRGAMYPFSLEPRLCARLTSLSRREGVTLFMTLLAAFKTLLFRYTTETDIVVGTPIANRTRPELEGLIGFFVNTLVLRTDLSGDPTFRELLGRVKEVTLGAYAHQDMPFEKLIEELQPERNLSYNPLFQVMLALQNIGAPDRSSPAQANPMREPPPVANGTAKFDLTFSMTEVAQGVQGAAEYNTDLFDETTVAGLIERFRLLLEGIVNNPDARISQFPLLGKMERRELSHGWSGPETSSAPAKTVCELIAAHAEQTPDAVAVSSTEQEITYRDLNRRVLELARRLRAHGVAHGARIGVLLERSPETVSAALAVLKAGGVYVPLDPAEPPARLALIVKNAGASMILTDERLGARLSLNDVQLFYVERDFDGPAQESDEELYGTVTADGLACLLYRSSREGTPQGVMLTHRALCRTAYGPDLAVNSSDRIAQASNLTYDAACFDLFGALAAGACVVCVPSHPPLAPRKLATLLRDRQVTVMFAAASVLERTAREFPWALRTLRMILCDDGPAALKRLREALDAETAGRVHVLYGSTESGGYCGVQQPPATLPAHADVAHIGSPAAGTKFYLLDTHLEPVPQGVVGEIYIGSEMTAHGYYARPASTAAAFVPDPFASIRGARLYATGDMARRLPGGGLELLGRRDRRITVRGTRVELEEVESALLRHEGVREAAVIAAHAPAPRDVAMTAFIVAADEQSLSIEELRRFLQEQLPEAMIPATLTTLDALPRNSSGEVDGHALSARAGDASGNAATPYAAPRNDTEERLANIWAQTFGIERIGVNDSFFRLGGHSLLATQVVARVSEIFEIDLPLGRLFETPTVAELSKVIDHLKQTGTKAKSTPIMRMAREAVSLPRDPEPPKH